MRLLRKLKAARRRYKVIIVTLVALAVIGGGVAIAQWLLHFSITGSGTTQAAAQATITGKAFDATNLAPQADPGTDTSSVGAYGSRQYVVVTNTGSAGSIDIMYYAKLTMNGTGWANVSPYLHCRIFAHPTSAADPGDSYTPDKLVYSGLVKDIGSGKVLCATTNFLWAGTFPSDAYQLASGKKAVYAFLTWLDAAAPVTAAGQSFGYTLDWTVGPAASDFLTW